MSQSVFCGDCGQLMTLVRPGKHQCDNPECSEIKDALRPCQYEQKIADLLGHALLVSKLGRIAEEAYQEGVTAGIREGKALRDEIDRLKKRIAEAQMQELLPL